MKEVSSVEDQGANADIKKEKCGVQYGGVNDGVRYQNPSVQVKDQHITFHTIVIHTFFRQMICIMHLQKAELMILK